MYNYKIETGDTMEFKKFIIVLSITMTIMVGLMCSISYGWYAYANAETHVEGTTLKDIPTVIFTQTDHIFSANRPPIYDKDRYNYAYKNSFIITIGENLKNYQTGIEISLKDIMMSNELKNSNYKYELVEDGKTISSGNFKDIGNSTVLNIKPMTVLTPTTYPETYTYDFYLWLSEDESNQNNLMNKAFSAKINVNSAVKK